MAPGENNILICITIAALMAVYSGVGEGLVLFPVILESMKLLLGVILHNYNW